MSLLLREIPPLLPLAAAVAVCDVAGRRRPIKWPNDIVVESPGPGREPGEARGHPHRGSPASRAGPCSGSG